MKHLFTLSERSKDKWVSFATFATFASAIFCKLVKLVNLVMQFLKLTKLTKLTEQIFAESLKSLKSLMSFFSSRGVKDVRVSLGQQRTNIQRISNLYLTPNRYFTRFAAVFALVFVLGVGQMWATSSLYKQTTFSSSNNSASIQDYTSSWSNTTSGFKVNITNANNNKNGWTYIKMGRKNNASTGTIITDAAIDKRITKVELVIDAITTGNITSIKLYKATSKSGTWSEIGTFAKGTGTKTVHIAAANQAANLYYKIEVVCTSGSSNGLITISGLKFYRSTFTVSYNSNGGSGTMTDSSSPYDTASVVTVKSNTFTAPGGKEFDGWKTGASSGTSYAEGATFNISANTTLYAQWKNSAVATPFINPSVTELDWGTVNKGADLSTKTFTITGSNLTAADLVYSASDGYSVSPEGKDGAAGALSEQTITVTPPSTATPGTYNSTVTISGGGLASAVSVDVKLTVLNTDQFIDELHGTSGYTSASPHIEAGSYGTTPKISDKAVATSGTCAQQHYHFVGWITAAKYEAGTAIAVGDLQTPTSATGATYYAVWAKQGAGGGSFDGEHGGTFKIYAEINSTKYYAQDASTLSSGKLSSTTNIAEAGDFVIEAVTGGFTIKSGDLYIGYGSSTNLTSGNVAYTWTFEEGSHGTWRVNSGTSGRAWIYRSGTVNKFGGYSTGNVNGTEYYDLEIAGSTSWEDYRAVCCTELGSINGSVNWVEGKAEIHCANLADVTSWGVKYKLHSDENYTTYSGSANWETYDDQSTNDMRKIALSDLNLTAGSQYDFRVTGTYSGSTYCTGAFEAALSPSSSSYVPKMENPSESSITDLGYIVGAATSTAQSFTISASRLTGNLTVTAPNSNFQVSTTSATAGFGNTATLTPTSGSLTNATVWVRLALNLEENEYGGNSTYVTISGGGAAGKQVSVSGIVGAACHTPSISGSLSNATYNLDANANALTISASKGDNSDPDLTYQWLQCATQNGDYVNAVGGTGATTHSYTPPTTTAGSDLYYKCKVNSGTCFAYSSVARIQVNTPIIKLNDATENINLAFGDKAVDAVTGYTMTFAVSGQYLAENISIAKSGTNEAMFTLSASSVSQTDGTAASTNITVTYKPSTAGSHSATLTLTSKQAASRTVSLSGTGKWLVTWSVGGQENPATNLAANEAKPTLPTPAPAGLTCKNTFKGWSKKDGKTIAKTTSYYNDLFTEASGAPAITEATTFYAVFGSASAPSTDLFSWEGGTASELTALDNVSANGLGSDYAAGNAPYRVKLDGTGDYIDITVTAAIASVAVDVKMLGGASSSSITVKESADGENFTDVQTLSISGAQNDVVNLSTTASFASTSRVVRLYFTKGSNVGVGPISITGVPVPDYVTECAAVEAPTFDPAEGEYSEAQTVTIASATDGAKVYYTKTTDGSTPADPTAESTEATSSITVDQNTKIKAIAIKGEDASAVVPAEYTFKVATPTISGSTSFVNSATVTIEATGADAIYYTTNGSDPTTESTPYTAPFEVNTTTTVKAIAVKANWTNSAVASQAFTKITPLDVATAITNISALDNNGTIANQFVKGIISQIDQYNSGDNTITYWISDDGTTTSQMEVYHGSAGVANGGNAFSAADNLKVGEEVIVSGTLKKYVSGNKTTPEFVNPNEIVAYKTHSPIAWSAGACTAELGGSENEYPTLSGTDGLTISYSSSDETVATISADGTTYDLKKVGSTTITATSEANASYVATTKSYTLTVAPTVIRVDLDIDCGGATSGCPATTHMTKQTNLPDPLPAVAKAGKNFGGWYTDNTFKTPAVAGASITENTTIYAQWLEPYTVADALTIISGLGANNANTISTEYYYVAGVVTDDAVSVSSNTATYKVKDSGESNELTVYKGKGLDNVNVTEASQIQEADEVVVYGLLQNYYGTAQIAQGNYIYSQVRPTFDVESVSLPSTANIRAGKTVTLTAEITPSYATDKAVTWESDDEDVATVENGVVTGVAEGTATITVTTHDGGKTATCTVTVAAELPTFTEDDHEWIKVSNASKLVAGRFYVIASETKNWTAGAISSGHAAHESTEFGDGIIASDDLGDGTLIFELGGTTGSWTLTEIESGLTLKENATKSIVLEGTTATWAITFDENGDATIGGDSRILDNTANYFTTYTSATSASMLLPQLYMWAELSHSVTFHANGGVAESVPGVERTDEGSIIIPATVPTHSDVSKAFGGWYKSDAPGTLYNAGDEFSTNEDVTLYAKWNTVPTYTVSYSANGGVGSAPAEPIAYKEGATITLLDNTGFTNPGLMYDGWIVTYNDGDERKITPEDGQFEMPAFNVVIKATWTEQSRQKWELVTNVSQLVVNAKYVIAAANADFALGTTQNDNYRSQTSVVKNGENDEILMGTSSMQVITLKGTTDAWEFNVGDGYLYAAGSGKSNNYLRTQETNDANGKWRIEIADGVTSITATGTNTNNQLKYNSSSTRFSCYASGQGNIVLYKEIPLTQITTNDKDQDDVPDNGDVEIAENKTWTVSNDKTVGDVYMKEGAVIANSAKVTAQDLYFKAKAGKSNQVFDASQLAVNGELYYDFQLCNSSLDADYWYSIAVPFDVNLNDGVYLADGTPMTNRSDFEVWEYDTEKRAQTMSNGWKRNTSGKMQAGKAYLIGFNPGMPNTIRLKAAPGWKNNLFSGTSISVTTTSTGTDHDNWNGIANPTMRYIDVNKDAQVFNNNTHGWDSYTLDATRYNFVVGTAFFVQSSSNVTISNNDHGNYRAPKRESENKCAYAVRIAKAENEDFDNQIVVRANENASNEYEQGHDMLTMNDATSKTTALLWTKNYGGKRLSIEEAPFVGDKASYELGIYAPANGTYFISVAEAKDNADLYLTYEGSIIWNLSAGAYEVELGKGATNEYGLMMVRKAPQVTTGVETIDNSQFTIHNCQKVILNDHVYILREGQLYDVTGKAVK